MKSLIFFQDQPCWPKDSEIAALNATLDPKISRVLKRGLETDPYPTAIPISSTEPLYGLGFNGLKGLYVRTDLTNNCDITTNLNEFCLANVKNNPDPKL